MTWPVVACTLGLGALALAGIALGMFAGRRK